MTFRRPTKIFEDGINLMHLNYLLAFDGVIASRGGIPLIDRERSSAQSAFREARIPRMKSSAKQERRWLTNFRRRINNPELEKTKSTRPDKHEGEPQWQQLQRGIQHEQ